MKRWLVAAAVALGLLAGCGSQPGSEYVGEWVNVKNDKNQMQIERNGESFMVRRTAPALFSGKVETNNIPASLKDGILTVKVGFSTINMSVDKASGNLTDGETEYRRVK